MTRILVVTHSPPWPTTTGTHQRTNLILRALRRCGHVDFALLPRSVNRYSADYLDHLRREFNLVDFVEPFPRGAYFPWRLIRPLRPSFVDMYAARLGRVDEHYTPDPEASRWLDRRLAAQRYDLIVGRYLQPTVYSGALLYSPVILDVDDMDTDRCRTELAMPGRGLRARWLLTRRLRQLERLEPALLRRPDHLWVCSETDRKIVGEERATVLSNIPFRPPDAPVCRPLAPDSNSQRVLFVGNLVFQVNQRGVDRFLERAWPLVRRSNPSATFRIVGTGLSTKQEARWSRVDGVEPVGFVDDLTEEYARAAITVAPLFEGGGSKIKVLESLAYGRTCVIARHAHRGFEDILRHRESLWVSDDDAAMATGCLALLEDSALRNRLAREGHELAMEHFTFEKFAETIARTVDTVLAHATGGVRRIDGPSGASDSD